MKLRIKIDVMLGGGARIELSKEQVERIEKMITDMLSFDTPIKNGESSKKAPRKKRQNVLEPKSWSPTEIDIIDNAVLGFTGVRGEIQETARKISTQIFRTPDSVMSMIFKRRNGLGAQGIKVDTFLGKKIHETA